MWIKDREIQAFEIEFSTGITSGGQRICNLIEATNDWLSKGYVVVVATTKDEREVNEKLGDRLFQKFVKAKKLFYVLTPSLMNIYKSLKKSPNLEVNIQGTIENIAKIPAIEPKLLEYR